MPKLYLIKLAYLLGRRKVYRTNVAVIKGGKLPDKEFERLMLIINEIKK